MKRLVRKSAQQRGTLYHFTSIKGLINILESDKLGKYEYISLTRDQNFFNHNRNIVSNGEVRISLNGDMLSENYSIKPFHDQEYLDKGWGYMPKDPLRYEGEERIKGIVDDVKHYITDISLYKSNTDWDSISDTIFKYLKNNTSGKFNVKEYDEKTFSIEQFVDFMQQTYDVIINIQ